MPEQLSEEEVYARAKKRVEDKRGFYIHAAIYLVVNAFVISQWMFLGGGYPWWVWMTGGWGVGVASHFMAVFVLAPEGVRYRASVEREAERIRRSDEGPGAR